MSNRFSYRMLLGGLPALVSTGVAAIVPLSGVLFLDPDQYAIWALVSTLSTMFLLFDFGAPALATKLSAESRASRGSVARIIALTAAPPTGLALVAILIWPSYAAASGLNAFPNDSVVLTIAAVGLGSSLRSVANVSAAISLGRQHYGVRAAVLLTSSFTMAAATLAALAAGLEILSLGVGGLAGGVLGTALAIVLEGKTDPGRADPEVSRLVRLFLVSKGAATILGLSITQLDRWGIGLAGDPDLLAQYDILTRVIQIPKIALLALFVGLVSESVRRSPVQLIGLWRKSTGLVSAAFVSSQFVALPVAVWLAAADTGFSRDLALLAAGVFVAQLALSATIPITLMLAGIGAPHRELFYLGPLCIGVAVVYAVGIATSNAAMIIAGWLVMVTVASFFYALLGPKLLREA